MPTYKAAVLPLLFALAACSEGFEVTRKAPEQVLLPDGTVVAGADGWCVDETTLRSGSDTSVVVLGSCAALARNPKAPRPDVPGIVTVSVETQPGASPTVDDLTAFFGTETGRTVLAEDGQADSVEVLEVRVEEDVLYIRSRDSSAATGANSQNWRAVFMLAGRFVSVSLFGRADRPIPTEDGFAAITAQTRELRLANLG